MARVRRRARISGEGLEAIGPDFLHRRDVSRIASPEHASIRSALRESIAEVVHQLFDPAVAGESFSEGGEIHGTILLFLRLGQREKIEK